MAERTTKSPPAPQARRALITGGAGFIGSHLADLLLGRGWHVTVIDNLSTGRASNLSQGNDLRPGLRFLEADLGQALQALGPGEQFDAIYHLAAAVGVKLVVDDPVRCIETNIDGTSDLLRFAMTHGPSRGPAPVFIASSSEVYGKSDKSPFSEEDDVVYGPTTRSRWSYAASKAIDEYLAIAYHSRHGLPTTIARFFNTVGPRQVGAYGMVLPNFVAAALADRPIPIYGDGRQSRCFCDVRDVVEALPALLENPSCRGRVFNIGSDQPITIEQLADTVVQTLHSASTRQHIPYDSAYGVGFEDLRQRVPDLTRIRAAIGFAPRRTLEQTIRDIAHSLRENPAASGGKS